MITDIIVWKIWALQGRAKNAATHRELNDTPRAQGGVNASFALAALVHLVAFCETAQTLVDTWNDLSPFKDPATLAYYWLAARCSWLRQVPLGGSTPEGRHGWTGRDSGFSRAQVQKFFRAPDGRAVCWRRLAAGGSLRRPTSSNWSPSRPKGGVHP